MNDISKKHHYLPKFYLKGFCRENGTFSVYDKEYNHFRKANQYPSSNFFEKYRNTIKINGIETDKIERIYSNFENGWADLFKIIRVKKNQNKILTQNGIQLIKTFLAIQFWRLPSIDQFAKLYIKNFDLGKLDKIFDIKINGELLQENAKIKELLKKDVGFQYYFRCFFLPLITFDVFSKENNLESWHILDVENEKEWSKSALKLR